MSTKFMPFSAKQLQVMSWWATPEIKDKYSAIIADGSIRSGKTFAMSLSFVIWSMSEFDGQNFGICGKSIKTCERNVIKPLLKMIGKRYNCKYNRSDSCITITGYGHANDYYIFGGKDESSQDLIQGITLAGVLLDEVALMPRSFVEQALGRCSVEGARFWFNCNPESPQHYIYREWILKAEQKQALHLHFLMDDNLTLSEANKKKYHSRFTGTFYRRFILGEWIAAEGLVYQSYHDKINDMLYHGDGSELRGEWYISMDYGTINPCSMGLWCVTPDRAVRVKEAYYDSRNPDNQGHQRSDEEHYAALDKLAGGRPIRNVICDPSAASFITTVRRHGKYRVRGASNDVVNGIRVTSALLTSGKVVIGDSCKDAIREFGLYRWDDKVQTDKVIKDNDHAMDDIRYMCYTILGQKYRYLDWRAVDD